MGDDALIDANVWGHVEKLTNESLAAHLELRARMLNERRPGPQLLEEAAERLRRADEAIESLCWLAERHDVRPSHFEMSPRLVAGKLWQIAERLEPADG